ncbi:hypothetical protein [Komagataeibacter swingsii]|uniref:Uncharacterized protein n=1 Tax=Komagataeibacter swingsii TaxID=215220 RepID=A0A850P4F7_9PROT|nr:hypothetical protein [Komagataeibacter swingsii]NVN37649.1 hypothetical protein [Komagataeibacter swingsii]
MRHIFRIVMACAMAICLAGCHDPRRDHPLYWHEDQQRGKHYPRDAY